MLDGRCTGSKVCIAPNIVDVADGFDSVLPTNFDTVGEYVAIDLLVSTSP